MITLHEAPPLRQRIIVPPSTTTMSAPASSSSSPNEQRTVATDALATLGSILKPGKEQRDAIHLAVEPVVAGEELEANQDVGFLPDGRVGKCDKPIGKVDPFLKQRVQPNQEFWLVIYPGKITSLRHVWEHPSVPVRSVVTSATTIPAKVHEEATSSSSLPSDEPETPRASYSRKWIEDYAARLSLEDDSDDDGDYRERVTADELIQGASAYLSSGDYLCKGSIFEGERLEEAFWEHYGNVTGEVVEEDQRNSFFTCSC
jgi:hypothetical protein